MRMLSGLGWPAAGIPEAAGDGWVETVAGEEFGETLAVLRRLSLLPLELLPWLQPSLFAHPTPCRRHVWRLALPLGHSSPIL